jgi:general secretion pathway protein A
MSMYAEYFGLAEPPFSITPDPRYLYMSGAHREAMAHLLYGIGEGGGFVQLTGEIGTGKTTVCRSLLDQLPPGVNVALILNPKLTDVELLASLCDELRIAYPEGTSSRKVLVDALYRHLLDAHARGERTALIIDEAQDLAPDVLEQIRLLTNLETPTRKLLQIIFIGQPELIQLLGRDDLRQLAQRITARYHLLPFAEEDTQGYITHRMAVAGQKEEVFTEAATREVHRLTGGVPRLINAICDRALLGAYAQDQRLVDVATVRRAASEVQGEPAAVVRRGRRWQWAAAIAAAAAVIAGATLLLAHSQIKLPWRAERISQVPANAALTSPVAVREESVASLMPSPAGPGGSTVTVMEPVAEAADPVAAPPSAPLAPAFDGSAKPNAEAATSVAAGIPQPTPSAAADHAAPLQVSSAHPPASPMAKSADSVSLGELLSDPKIRADKEAAFVSLYARWRLDFDSSKYPLACARGKAEGLECLFRAGSWAKLRRFDLPAIIELSTPSGEKRYATVVSLDESTATLDLARRRYAFPLSEIDRYWGGPFIVLWRAPGTSSPQIVPGSHGKDVVWLRQRLSEIDGAPPGGRNREVFDDELRSRVMAFQRSRSLPADGIVGEDTLAELDPEHRSSGAPRLVRAKL